MAHHQASGCRGRRLSHGLPRQIVGSVYCHRHIRALGYPDLVTAKAFGAS